jgi:hypothetical protein
VHVLAWTVVSTIGTVICALTAVWALMRERRTKPQVPLVVVIIVRDGETSAVECQPDRKAKRVRLSRRRGHLDKP